MKYRVESRRRSCYACGSIETYITKNGYQHWFRNNDRENNRLCYSCMKEYCCNQSYKTYKHMALIKVGRNIIKCVNCGCDNENLLEINHINGGGYRDCSTGVSLYHRIVNGTRDIRDLNILCRVCNSLHYLEIKHSCRLPYMILWSGLKV